MMNEKGERGEGAPQDPPSWKDTWIFLPSPLRGRRNFECNIIKVALFWQSQIFSY